ncbi:MAG TPA: metalloregulator ArsR/SmtB family transcription factor [Candidatus Limnocylindrales bacterium]|jgi:ArsR family transcriptional regulator
MKPMDADVQLLQALADPTRLAIVRELAGQPEVCACNLTDCCGVRQPTVSHHLKVLREAGVVLAERRGTWIYYRLDPAAADRLTRVARELVPGGLIPVAALRERRPAVPSAARPS